MMVKDMRAREDICLLMANSKDSSKLFFSIVNFSLKFIHGSSKIRIFHRFCISIQICAHFWSNAGNNSFQVFCCKFLMLTASIEKPCI